MPILLVNPSGECLGARFTTVSRSAKINAWRTVYGRAPAQVGALIEAAIATSMDVLIAAKYLLQNSEARREHQEGLIEARIAVAAAVVLAAVPHLVVHSPATAAGIAASTNEETVSFLEVSLPIIQRGDNRLDEN